MTNRRTWQTALLWAVALVIVNALWLSVVDQSAPNEINAENQFQTHRETYYNIMDTSTLK